MDKITESSHSKVLGFALVAFGAQFLPSLFGIFQRNFIYANFPQGEGVAGATALLLFLWEGFTLIIFLLVSLLAGTSTLSYGHRFRFPGVLFVLLAFTVFPIGTILSGYVLYYLFVVGDNKSITDPEG